MKSVFELISKHIEPSIKRSLVESLLKRGISRTAIAKCLDISIPLVTRYAKRERGLHDFTSIVDVSEKVERLADRVAESGLCGEALYSEIARLVMYVLARKYACGIHYSLDRHLNPAKCNVCPSIFSEVAKLGTNL